LIINIFTVFRVFSTSLCLDGRWLGRSLALVSVQGLNTGHRTLNTLTPALQSTQKTDGRFVPTGRKHYFHAVAVSLPGTVTGEQEKAKG
jgi:hypothetical protein